MTLSAYCVRCGEAFEPAPDPSGYVSEMCPPCRAVVAAEAQPLDEATAYTVDRALEWSGAAPARADIDEPDRETWRALAATFDAMDLDPDVRHDIREMMLRAWAGGAEARADDVRSHEDSDAWDEFLAALDEAGIDDRTLRQDIEDHAAAHARYCEGMAVEDDSRLVRTLSDARADLAAVRESLGWIRQFLHATDVLPAARLGGEMTALDAQLSDIEHRLTVEMDD